MNMYKHLVISALATSSSVQKKMAVHHNLPLRSLRLSGQRDSHSKDSLWLTRVTKLRQSSDGQLHLMSNLLAKNSEDLTRETVVVSNSQM